jgi:AhpD family alkylhydroperoxidase
VPEALDPLTKELAAIAAAVAGHCQPCFTYHHKQALAVGASPGAIQAVIELARTVRSAGDRHMDEFVTGRMSEEALKTLATGPAGEQPA